MKKIIKLVFVLWIQSQLLPAQSNWTHVGPKSDNQLGGNGFETAQLDNIAVDPANDQHLFASSWFGGLWESTDRGANWLPVESSITGTNGVSAITFLSSTEILVGSHHVQNKIMHDYAVVHRNCTKGAWKFNFATDTWTALGAMPNPGSVPFAIRTMAVHPANSSLLFACTSIGLFRSTDGGATWLNKDGNFIENIVFVPNTSSGYYCFITGSGTTGNYNTPTGTMIVKESFDDGLTFTNLTSNFSLPSPYTAKSHSRLCFNPTPASGSIKLFLYSLGIDAGNSGREFIHSFNVNISTGAPSAYVSPTTPVGTSGTFGSSDRMGFAFDPVNNGLWYGGVKLSFLNLATGTYYNSVKAGFHSSSGNIHDDIHDIVIKNYSGQYEIYVACDGGIVRSNLNLFVPGTPSSSVYFNPLNNGLHVSMVRGFSGTEADPNLYAVGGQDIVNSDVYDAATGKNRYTHQTWENDGALIDKNNASNMFFDQSSYDSYYRTSTDGGANISGYGYFYEPNASAPFQQGAYAYQSTAGFSQRLFFQDPYRDGKVYFCKYRNGITQYDNASGTFVIKIDPLTSQPNYNAGTGTGDFGIRRSATDWGPPIPAAMSFSPQTPNSLHYALNGSYHPSYLSRPAVIKYVGNDLSDCWKGHNEAYYTDGTGTHPQWATLTATLWEDLGIPAGDLGFIDLKEIETSPWNKDRVYLMLEVPNRQDLKVLKYDGGVWTNYSNGLPNGEVCYSMIMDRASNDAIYLATDVGVYFRDAASSSWTLYNNGLPKLYSRQMEVNLTENTVRTGTYGRGIWKSDLNCPASPLPISGCSNCGPTGNLQEGTYITINNSTYTLGRSNFRAVDYIEILPGSSSQAVTLGTNAVDANQVFLFIHGCSDPGNTYKIMQQAEQTEPAAETSIPTGSLSVYPNPNNGTFTVSVPEKTPCDIYVYDLMGKIIYSALQVKEQNTTVSIGDFPKGIYIVKVINGNSILTQRVISQ